MFVLKIKKPYEKSTDVKEWAENSWDKIEAGSPLEASTVRIANEHRGLVALKW